VEYALASLATRSRPFRVIEPTAVHETDLFRLYTPVIQRWRNSASRAMSIYATATATGVLTGLEEEDSNSAAEIAALLLLIDWRSFFGGMEAWHRRKWLASVSAATGVDATYLARPATGRPVAVIVQNRAARRAAGITRPSIITTGLSGIDRAVADAVAANVSLVRSVSDEARARIANAVIGGVRRGASAGEVARQLNAGLKLSRARVGRIAEDQVDKAVKAFTKARMIEAGLTVAEWEHNTPRNRARLHHLARNKKVYRLSDPVWQELMLPNCRCQQRPRLEGLV
jgi:hypothetical protein